MYRCITLPWLFFVYLFTVYVAFVSSDDFTGFVIHLESEKLKKYLQTGEKDMISSEAAHERMLVSV